MSEFSLIVMGESTEFGDLKFLETYRFTNGLSFPNSYKEFAKKYGYGVALEQFHIYIPMSNYGDSWMVRMEEIRNTYHADVMNKNIWFDLEPDGSIELIERLIPFASNDNGYYLFWDPEGIHENENELDIYITDFRGLGFRKIGESLYEVVNNLTSDKDYNQVIFFLQKPLSRSFKPLKKRQV